MSLALENLLVQNAQKAKAEKIRIEALRDGTEAGDLKAEYLERVYRRHRTKTCIAVLDAGGVSQGAEPRVRYVAEVEQIDAELPEIEARLDAMGVRIKKRLATARRYDEEPT